jgi:transporter family protein
MIDWLAPALGFTLAQGALGATTKLALRGIGWKQLLLYTAAAYAVIALGLVAAGTDLTVESHSGWAALAGVCAASGLAAFFVALGRGPASQVVPVTAGYPLAGVIFAAIILGEAITPLRVVGTVLVVTGIVILSRN